MVISAWPNDFRQIFHAIRKLKTYGRVSGQTCKKRRKEKVERGREKREEGPYFTIKAQNYIEYTI
jgi:hypothetical protein